MSGDKAKAREQNSIIKFDITWPKTNNPTLDPVDSIPFDNLMIQTDGPDKRHQRSQPHQFHHQSRKQWGQLQKMIKQN